MHSVSVTRGNSPLVLAQPHSGTWLPEGVRELLNEEGRELLDTDWRIPELYAGLVSDASTVRANFSRYVIDANRPPDGQSLYPGQNTTGLVPLTTFDDRPIWLAEPDSGEIARRLDAFHKPYHAALIAELERTRAQHGFAILFDCHSIRSTIPFLFDGKLPDLNIGTNAGASCDQALESAVANACKSGDFTSVLNGRFKGGWTTRHYGRPAEGLHAIQMEIAQSAYLESEEPPFALSSSKSAQLRVLLGQVFDAIHQTFGEIS